MTWFQGRVWKFGDNVDTDAIVPARYLNVSTPEELAAHCMEGAVLEPAATCIPSVVATSVAQAGDIPSVVATSVAQAGDIPSVVATSVAQAGDIIVAGANFGCGSSREHAPLAIKGAGVRCVIAASFARIFYRNAINMGLPILECPAAVAGTQTGQTLQVCLSQGTIVNLDTGQAFQAAPYPLFLMGIIEAGGLIPYTRRRMQEEGVL